MSNIERLARELLVVIGVKEKTYPTPLEAHTRAMKEYLNDESIPPGTSVNLQPFNYPELDSHEDNR